MINQSRWKTHILLVQLVGTLSIMFLVDNTALATLLLLCWWLVTFFPLAKRDLVLFFLSAVVFIGIDVMVLQQGVFHFTKRDILEMPYYELLLWGFYFLHGSRLLGGQTSKRVLPGVVFSILVLGTLAFIPVVTYALVIAAVILLGALVVFRTAKDFQYVSYFLCIGVIIEFLGTRTGKWSYSITDYLAWWMITWAISGLVLYRLILPVSACLARYLAKEK